MKITELGLRTFLDQNDWNSIGEDIYTKTNRRIEIQSVLEKFICHINDEHLLTSTYSTIESGLIRYFIIS